MIFDTTHPGCLFLIGISISIQINPAPSNGYHKDYRVYIQALLTPYLGAITAKGIVLT